MPDVPAVSDEVAGLRAANARLRQVIEAKDTEIAALRTSHQAQLNALRGLLRITVWEKCSSLPGAPPTPRVQHAAALDAACEVGEKHEQARAHLGLAHAYQASGETGEACYHNREALICCTELGAPEADQIRAQLPTGNPPSGRRCQAPSA